MATPTTLPATFTAGSILTALQMNNLRGAFRVLQVVGATTTTSTSTTSATFVTTTLTATITPGFTTSKVLVASTQHLWNPTANTEADLELVRGATQIFRQFPFSSAANNLATPFTTLILDSPNTTSATTYTVNFRRASGAGTLTTQVNSSHGGIVLMEISA